MKTESRKKNNPDHSAVRRLRLFLSINLPKNAFVTLDADALGPGRTSKTASVEIIVSLHTSGLGLAVSPECLPLASYRRLGVSWTLARC